MDISNSIKQLLYEHDCVILPNFGGFVCAHKKLEFNNTAMDFIQSKAIGEHIKQRDNGFDNYWVVEKDKIGYTKALENINAWVSGLHHQLQQGQTVNISGLGSFSLNTDKRVVFVPFADINFSTNTYGLATIKLNKKIAKSAIKEAPKVILPAPPPKPTVEPKKVEEKEVKAADIRPTKPPKRKKRGGYKILRRMTTIVFTLLVFFAFFIYQDYAYHSIIDRGGLMDFNTSLGINTNTNNNLKATEYSNSKGNETVTNSDNEGSEMANSLENSTVTQTDVETSIVQTAKTDSVFYIIAAAFSSESNANDLLENLNRKGFASEIINIQGSSLYRVGYKQYPSRKKAEGDLNAVRNKTHNFAAWILAVKP